MQHLHLFTDGSVNAQTKMGFGARLLLSNLNPSESELQQSLTLKCFEQTSSTKLELQMMLWALTEAFISAKGRDISVTAYTDSQNIIGLLKRRERLEQSRYISSRGQLLNNAGLYQDFYRLTDQLRCQFVKVIGHQPSCNKTNIERLFERVDKASRRAMREAPSLNVHGND